MNTVPTSCLARLQPCDFEFISLVLTGESSNLSAIGSLLVDSDTLGSVLEQPQLLQAILELSDPLSISAELYFFVLVRHNLSEAGIDDVGVADYVAATLAEHSRGNAQAERSSNHPEASFNYHIDFIEQLAGVSGYDLFFLHVQCGNHFLVMTGLFPIFLRRRSQRRGAPGVGYYEGVARNAYLAARDHPLAEEFALADVYGRLANRFAETRRALNRMAEEYLFLGS